MQSTQVQLAPIIRQDDIPQHAADERMYWVCRKDCPPIQLTWNELTPTERQWLQEADERAVYSVMFDLYQY